MNRGRLWIEHYTENVLRQWDELLTEDERNETMPAKVKSYWNGNGRFQKRYNRLRAKLVPDSGEAATDEGEMLRCLGNLVYDWFNNGCCNRDIRKDQACWLWSRLGLFYTEAAKLGIDKDVFKAALLVIVNQRVKKDENGEWVWEHEKVDLASDVVISYVARHAKKKEAK